jgi:hypothetical protein
MTLRAERNRDSSGTLSVLKAEVHKGQRPLLVYVGCVVGADHRANFLPSLRGG